MNATLTLFLTVPTLRNRRRDTGAASAPLELLRRWRRDAAARRQLLRVSDRLLRDAGLDGDESLREARRRFRRPEPGTLVRW